MRKTFSLLTIIMSVITLLPLATVAQEAKTESEQKTPAAPSELLTAEELAEGWIALFDGETLYGWRPNKEANWHVADGAITADEGKPTLLCTTSQWGNYALKLEFKTVSGGNSGVFLRTPPKLGMTAAETYEVNITGPDTKNPCPTGGICGRQNAKPPVPPSDQWQTMEMTADGARILVKVNGVQVVDYTDPTPLGRGFIGLQYRAGKIQFRNIKLRPLGEKVLFNGKDLTGWNTYPDMASVVSVTEKGELNVKNGKGQLETKDSFGDFTLQLEVFVDGKDLNSGIFFRCIPGETMNGYECQIHNGFLDGDRNKPANCGTGGFFRRQDARRVVSDDFAWFFQTIHADGNHMAAWVNGYQVSDWVDRRKPDKNPRRGLRLEPGTIMIQGHDPTTNLSFRNIRISELPER